MDSKASQASQAPKSSKRIFKEVKSVSEMQESCGVKVDFKEDSVVDLRGEIVGPQGTVYEGGNFVLDISLPNNYPFSPPVVTFATKIWHPNIDSQTGQICLDILKNNWKVILSLGSVMLSIQYLLAAPEGGDALDEFVAKQYICHYEVFEQTARHWTNVFAGGSNKEPELEQKIEEMKALGFEEDKSRVALSNSHWVINDAIASFATD